MIKHSISTLCAGALLLFTALLPACSKSGSKTNVIIDSVSRTSIHGGDTVTVYGKNLPANAGAFTVILNGKPFMVIRTDADSVVVVVPKMAGSGVVALAVGKDTVRGPSVTYNYLATVTTIAGHGAWGNDNGSALASSFEWPWGITADANGDLYIADGFNRSIRKYTAASQGISQIPIPSTVAFNYPYNIALDRATHNLYLTDFNAHVLKVHSDNTCSTIYNDSTTTAGIAVGPDGYIYVANNTYGLVIRMDTSGNNRALFGSSILSPRNLIFDKTGDLYISAIGIYEIPYKGVQTQLFIDKAFQGFEIARDTLGNIYEADHSANVLRMVEASSGNIFTVAGSGTGADVDGVGLSASFDGPEGLCIDDSGVLYMTTFDGNTMGSEVRKITIQ